MPNVLDGLTEEGPLPTPSPLKAEDRHKGSGAKVHQSVGFGVAREGCADGGIIAILKGARALAPDVSSDPTHRGSRLHG